MSAAVAGLGGALGIAGGVVQGQGAQQQLEAQAQGSDYQAAVAEQNMTMNRQQAREEARRLRIEGNKNQGQIRANIAASGVQSDASGMDVLTENAESMELDALTVLYSGEIRARGFGAQAAYASFAARSARSQKFYAGASAILGGLGKGGTAIGGIM